MPQRTLYLESVAGIAGDMFTAAFLDAGLVAPEAVQAVPEALGVPEATVEVAAVQRAGARFTKVRVVGPGGVVEGEPRREEAKDQGQDAHRHYHYPPLARRIEESGLEPRAKAFALEVFRLLAEAEADSHGVPVEKVAFHEVGAVDSVVDVAMAGVCLATVPADRVLASPVKLGRGRIRIDSIVRRST